MGHVSAIFDFYKAFSLYRHPESLAVLRASLWPKSKGATFWGKNDNTTTSTGFKSHQLGKSHINPMAGRFGRKSHQRKKVTSICQNYNGTAAVARCFQKAKITQNTAHIGASVYFFFTFWCPHVTNHNGTLVSNSVSPTKATHINMSELQWQQILHSKIKRCTNNTFAPTSLQWYHHIKANNNI